MIRVLVAEDSAAVRMLLVSILGADPEIEVVGEASSGEETIRLTERLRPDVITMDIHMPGMNGIEATEAIMAKTPTPIVIVSSAVREQDVAMSLQATSVGALTAIPKPEDPKSPLFQSRRELLIMTVKTMSQVKVVRRWSKQRRESGKVRDSGISRNEAIRDALPIEPSKRLPGAPVVASAVRSSIAASSQIVAIAASTGGPAALQQILSVLPRSFPLPILVVQHIAEGFISALAQWLAGSCAVRIVLASEGELVVPGTVYLAPHGSHLGVNASHQIALSSRAAIGGFRPSATYLFSSVAQVYGTNATGVILTGMGRDGIDGLKELHATGGRVIAQDEASCVVYGMPQEAVKAGVVDEVATLDEIAEIVARTGTR